MEGNCESSQTLLPASMMFEMQRKAPAIIFIDELDAIGQKRSGGGELSGVREVQRTMLELLNQLAAWLLARRS